MVGSVRVGFSGNAVTVVKRKPIVTNEFPMFSAILVCSLFGGGCAEDGKFGEDGEVSAPANEADATKDSSASTWSTSDDGKLSLRIVTAHGPISADEPVWVLAELRNDSDENLAVLRPFGDQYEAESSGFEIAGPDGKVDYGGPKLTYVLGADAFTYLVPGEALLETWSTDALQDWLQLTEANRPGLGEPGRYTIRFNYRATPSHQEMAKQSGRFVGQKRLWTGEIRTGHVAVTKRARDGDGSDAGPAISVRIPSGEYRFTLAEAAVGVRFSTLR